VPSDSSLLKSSPRRGIIDPRKWRPVGVWTQKEEGGLGRLPNSSSRGGLFALGKKGYCAACATAEGLTIVAATASRRRRCVKKKRHVKTCRGVERALISGPEKEELPNTRNSMATKKKRSLEGRRNRHHVYPKRGPRGALTAP